VRQRGQVHDRTVAECGERVQFAGAEQTALVEECLLRGGDDGPVCLTESDLGRGR
jgi:hypothetical protein